ncbi:MAG: hypothetical protein AB1765_06865, partial [Candidatus Hydrogenedentota bacterium]
MFNYFYVVNDYRNNQLSYAARFGNVLSVGATNGWDERIKKPDYFWGSNYGDGIDVVAPGRTQAGYVVEISRDKNFSYCDIASDTVWTSEEFYQVTDELRY